MTAPETNGQPHAADLRRLADKFPASAIEWRIGQSGVNKDGKVWAKVLAYVTNRAIMDRLDHVCGPGNWRNEFREWQGQLHPLRHLRPRRRRVGDEVGRGRQHRHRAGQGRPQSGAMKRAAVQWGIGRYLYDLDEGWADIRENGEHYAKTKDGKSFRWNPPPLPDWALPSAAPPPPHDSIEANRASRGERADTRQAHPQPPTAVTASQQQYDAFRDIAAELRLSGEEQSRILYDAKVKRFSHLTVENADRVVLELCRRAVRKLLTELTLNLDDVRMEDPSVTADTPDELDQEQANAALAVLRRAKETANV
jgi:hypothetical protein